MGHRDRKRAWTGAGQREPVEAQRSPGFLAARVVVLVVSVVLAMSGEGVANLSVAGASVSASATAPTTWLCRPGLANDPCTSNLATTKVEASGASSTVAATASASSRFDCFYVYPTVSREPTTNADLRIQKSEVGAAMSQASRFSQVCRVYAPIYRQVTLLGLAAYPSLDLPPSYEGTAYDSLLGGFNDYLAHYNDGRPIVFIGHSQGAALLIDLLARTVDDDAALRNRLVLAIILGGDVEVHTGSLTGGSFEHIPACTKSGEHGCVIAYSSFPGEPPGSSLFGRPGQGVALQSGQNSKHGLQVVCVNPAAPGGGSAELDPYFPSEGAAPTPWIEFPGLYKAQCETAAGATWLQVGKATGSSDKRPIVTEQAGPDWGYHADDVNLALGNLISDVSSAERTWSESKTP